MKKRALQLWSLEAAARELVCKVSTLRTYIKTGELTAIWVVGRHLIKNDEILAYIERKKNVPVPCERKRKIVGRRCKSTAAQGTGHTQKPDPQAYDQNFENYGGIKI
jgi:hypothetical protein